MNKKVYSVLKQIFLNENKKQKIENELLRDWDDLDILKYNTMLFPEEGRILSEIECKTILLLSNRMLFTEVEYEYYNNILSLKRFLKKEVKR